MQSADWVFICKPDYLLSHAVPAAIAWRERFSEPAALHILGGAVPPGPAPLRLVPRAALAGFRRALAFDIPSLLTARLHRLQSVYLHHSLVGKGRVPGGWLPYPPLLLAGRILLPDPALLDTVSPLLARRAGAVGHLPLDWLRLPESWLPPAAAQALAAWRATPRPRVLLLATRGRLSAADVHRRLLERAAAWPGLAFKPHPGLSGAVPGGGLRLDELPVPLAIAAADLVLADHSSVVGEALRLQRPVAVFVGAALRQLRRRRPDLPELGYWPQVGQYADATEAAALIDACRPAPAPPAPCGVSAGAGLVRLLAGEAPG